MAGKKGRSGPPGNLHAARHGYVSWRKRRALPIHLRHVNVLVEQEEKALISDKGGEGMVTVAECLLRTLR